MSGRQRLKLRFLITVFLFGAATSLIYQRLERPGLGTDDALIFFTYAENIVDGYGVVYNPGGERVEGFSSPMWLAIVTVAHALFSRASLPLLYINVMLVSLALAVLWNHADGEEFLTWRGLLILLWTLGAPAYTAWMTVTLMDTALWSTLLILATVTVLSSGNGKSYRHLSVLIALLLLARPEGIVWSALFIIIALFLETIRKNLRAASIALRGPLLTYIATTALLFTARLLYFGYPLPNTYYAKVSPDYFYNVYHGVIYLREFLVYNPIALFLALGLPVASMLLNLPRIIKGHRQSQSDFLPQDAATLVAASVIALFALVVPIITGGDHFVLFRFYQPPWPLLLLPALALPHVIEQRIPRAALWFGMATLATLFLLAPLPNWFTWQELHGIGFEIRLGAEGRRWGQILNQLFPDDRPSVGVVTAGGFGLEYEGATIDLLGLNNAAMAHAPGERKGYKNHSSFSATVFFDQQPQLVILPHHDDLADTTDLELCHTAEDETFTQDLLEKPRFWQLYDRVLLRRGSMHVPTYVAHAYVATLQQKGFVVESLNCPAYAGISSS